ncbi:hypothetical protein HGM15179_010158 [Zosterops borbonicus]|uniref:Uncharacterized protein n=1 Tax=Zosterops borbonicus TaxID=364589 RepID=A0A8K1LKA1_9PASS|nr:hypothetical protein HGM15179_010158 [Zosterops borbonicus]
MEHHQDPCLASAAARQLLEKAIKRLNRAKEDWHEDQLRMEEKEEKRREEKRREEKRREEKRREEKRREEKRREERRG